MFLDSTKYAAHLTKVHKLDTQAARTPHMPPQSQGKLDPANTSARQLPSNASRPAVKQEAAALKTEELDTHVSVKRQDSASDEEEAPRRASRRKATVAKHEVIELPDDELPPQLRSRSKTAVKQEHIIDISDDDELPQVQRRRVANSEDRSIKYSDEDDSEYDASDSDEDGTCLRGQKRKR